MPSQFDTIVATAQGVVDAQNYTSTQVANMTQTQLAALLGLDENAFFWSGGNYGYFTAIRSRLAQDILDQENQSMVQSIKAALTNNQKQWIITNAPRIIEFLEEQE